MAGSRSSKLVYCVCNPWKQMKRPGMTEKLGVSHTGVCIAQQATPGVSHFIVANYYRRHNFSFLHSSCQAQASSLF
jgi:hypothetical protein